MDPDGLEFDASQSSQNSLDGSCPERVTSPKAPHLEEREEETSYGISLDEHETITANTVYQTEAMTDIDNENDAEDQQVKLTGSVEKEPEVHIKVWPKTNICPE